MSRYLAKPIPFTPSSGIVVLLVAASVLAAFLQFRAFLTAPVSVLFHADPGCEGTLILVDGKEVMKVTRTASTLHFGLGKHTVEARRAGCTGATMVFNATDSEQGSRDTIVLSCTPRKNGCHLYLRVD